ncbi:efflux RND transporter periplasmic adaptor subunit [Cytophaga sp. FL35]|uniref:efflux RND transporter periplasmic adaptor subunit n=1 Tax=Cytophaga sp. FL35 TaxID=1904456 RepID=UPI001653CE06|nr:efflux RND transporter periplasmic adaptor subunit [Cytophaga sp. FL35]MBC7000808.1 efflux RND transporter periplasmic adaptor subunit [Cytophaga sp. FL35]
MILETMFKTEGSCFNFKFKYLLLVLPFLILVSCGEEVHQKTSKVIKVRVLNVGSEQPNVTQKGLKYSGTITSEASVNTSFQVSGTVLKIPVQIGDFVKKNQLLAQIDPTTYNSQYEQLRSQEQLAKENFERINEVYSKGSIAEIRMLEAKSQYEQAKAAAKMTYQNVRHTSIYAPMDGYISDKLMEPGDLAQPGQPVVEIVNIKAVKAVIPIPDDEINNLSKGDTAVVKISSLANYSVSGVVDEISIQANQGSPVYTAYVQLGNENKTIKPGMACTATFENTIKDKSQNGQNLIIPSESIAVTENGKHFVYVINNDQAERRYVEIGQLYDNGIAIEDGLSKGEKLIVSGYHKLIQSTPVEIMNDAN